MKRKCTNCAFCERFKYFQTDKTEMMRCWHETGVCDHAFVISMVRAEKYKCDNHRFQNERDKELFEEAKLEYEIHKKAVEKLEKKYPQLEKLNVRSEISNDLEEAAKDYTDSSEWLIGENLEHIDAAFISGAKWQADHTPLPEDTVLFNKGVAEGKRLMMEEAVEKTVFQITRERTPVIMLTLDANEYKDGDKVHVIVIKEN